MEKGNVEITIQVPSTPPHFYKNKAKDKTSIYKKKKTSDTKETNKSRNQSVANETQNVSPIVQIASQMLNRDRCKFCGQMLEIYDEETIGLGLVCLSSFVNREPSLAAPYLLDMLMTATKIISNSFYTWNASMPNVMIPGNAISIARQFIRCVLYNLAPNGIFNQLMHSQIKNENFFRVLISVLIDFEEHMNIFQPLTQLLDSIQKQKTIVVSETFPLFVENITAYFENLPNLSDDAKANHMIATGWSELIPAFEVFLRKLLISVMNPVPFNLGSLMRAMICILRSPVAGNFKTVIDTFAAVIRLIIESTRFHLPTLIEVCSICNRTFKERIKSQLTKTVTDMLHQAIKFRISLPDENLMKLLQFLLMDCGGTVEPNQICENLTQLFNPHSYHLYNTGSAEIMKPHLPDCLSFLGDVHSGHKIKMSQKSVMHFGANIYFSNGLFYAESSGIVIPANAILVGGIRISQNQTTGIGSLSQTFANNSAVLSTSSNEDIIGAHFKSGIAQFVALELSRNCNISDSDVLSQLSYGLMTNIDDSRLKSVTISPQPISAQHRVLQNNPSIGGQLVSSVVANATAASTSVPLASTGGSQPPILNDPTSITSIAGERNKNPQSLISPGSIMMSGPSSTISPSLAYQSITRHDCPLLHHLPWLKTTQQTTAQQGPREFLLTVERARTLTWILIGANVHLGLTQDTTGLNCRPVPLCFVRIIADIIKNILLGYPDQQRNQSVMIMSALNQAFILCLQWTVYCEAIASISLDKSIFQMAQMTALEFWIRIMPSIYNILGNSEDFQLVTGHLLTLMEELIEIRSSTVTQLIGFWVPILHGNQKQLPGNMLKRLQKCMEFEIPELNDRVLMSFTQEHQTISSQDFSTKSSNHIKLSNLLACNGCAIVGCNPASFNISGTKGQDLSQGSTQCLGHSFTSLSRAYLGGVDLPSLNSPGNQESDNQRAYATQGICSHLGGGTDLLCNRFLSWLKKQIFITGKNEDQHSTASSIFIK